jgi:hypothetical protein
VSFAYVASQLVFIVIPLSTQSGNFWIHPHILFGVESFPFSSLIEFYFRHFHSKRLGREIQLK